MKNILIFLIILFSGWTTTANAIQTQWQLPPLSKGVLPINEDKAYYEKEFEVSAYNAEVGQTDDRPFEMASGKNVYSGAIACPRNIKLGTKIEINNKIYTCEDRMNKRYNNNVDIFMWSKSEALNFGRQKLLTKIFID
jgi:3D (Asp-Asp-Asp) domain-containing protein